jgi:ADP-ribose pyrophosphatase
MKITESREVYKCKLFRVTEDKAVDPKTGFEINRSVVRHNGSAVILAVHKRTILLVRQYRLPAEKPLWELPAGKVDEGETPLAAAKRELAEETGYTAVEWSRIGVIHTAIAYTDEAIEIFLARKLSLGKRNLDAGEFLETLVVEFDEAIAMIRDGRITDAKTVAALLLVKELGPSRRA